MLQGRRGWVICLGYIHYRGVVYSRQEDTNNKREREVITSWQEVRCGKFWGNFQGKKNEKALTI